MWAEASLICVVLVLLSAAAGWLVRREALRREEQVLDVWHSLVDTPADGQPSQLALAIKATSRMMADEIKQSLSGAMMGQASAVSKQLAAMEGDVATDGISQSNPLLGLLLNFSPSLRKRLAKNPAAALALSGLDIGGMLKKMTGGGGNVAAGSAQNGRNHQSSFNL